VLEPIERFDRHEVDEVPGLRPAEDGEHLVDRELLPAQGRGWTPRLRREEPSVRREVELSPFVPSGNQQPREAGVHLNALDGEAACLERALYRGNQPVDSLAREPEEVEVARLTLDISAHYQRRPAGKRKPLRLVKIGDDLGDGAL
jgi:hypothetical protein